MFVNFNLFLVLAGRNAKRQPVRRLPDHRRFLSDPARNGRNPKIPHRAAHRRRFVRAAAHRPGQPLTGAKPLLKLPQPLGIGTTCSVRRGDWKLIYYYDSGRKELFNIRTDIGERHNLATEQPTKVNELSRRLGCYLRRTDAQRPSFKATGEPCP